jgi:hypothetical protein
MARKRTRELRVGDKVEILHYRTSVSWYHRKPQKYGFVEYINGAYIRVRPRWWPKSDWVWKYPGEIRLVSK